MAPPCVVRGRLSLICVAVVVLTLLPSEVTADNGTDAEKDCETLGKCKPGLMFPLWEPIDNLSSGDKAARATVYFASLCFMFLGVSIIADRFMAAIEVITSKEREITIKKPNGETTVMNVRIWNETVSNLTLMALGSSAPEILLSIIEVCGNNFNAGDLGPGTIVGSAAFNLFIIVGLCVYVIPDDEVRRIKHLRVFFITATWSVFAYLWLYMIIAVITPGVINWWEGIITLLYFPITVLTAYVADKQIFFYKFLSKRYRAGKKSIVLSEGNELEMGDKTNHLGDDILFKGLDHEDAEIREFEKHRREYIEIIRELRKKHPNVDMKTLEEMAEYEVMNRGPKSRAFYRIQATRKLTGGGNVIKKTKLDRKSSLHDVKVDLADDDITRIFFEPGHYTVMENVGSFQLTVARQGGSLDNTVYVDYRTEDGTANAGSDFEHAEGTVIFHPGETRKTFTITIMDDDVFEEDEHFYVQLSNLRTEEEKVTPSTIQLANPCMATVMILDDDHSGIFQFEQNEISFPESIGEAGIKVSRSSGARGKVKIPYRTIEGTAKGGGKDYEDSFGEVIFHNDETEGYIKVHVVDDEEYEKNEEFYIELGEPILVKSASDEGGGFAEFIKSHLPGQGQDYNSDDEYDDDEGKKIETQSDVIKDIADMTEDERIAELGRPRLGEACKITCHIRESMEFKNTVDKLLKKANVSLAVGTSSWREQFIEAVTVSAGPGKELGEGDDDEDDGVERLPSCMDYVMHFLTIFWKVLFAFVPPTDYFDGWAAFWTSLFCIGLLTVLIGDVASGFGCTIGLKDSVTAISFVALGTSLPDYWGGWACFTMSIMLIGLLTGAIADLASGFGCTVGLKDSVNAITFVALGTSLPDTFASKVAAIGDQYADSCIGNVTGSNAVNVFLGIGVAWSIAAVYHAINGTEFVVEQGSLGFSVTVFCVCAVIAIMVMLLRRTKAIGGELGGPRKYKIATSCFFFLLWIIYVLFSSLESYCHIKGF